MSDASLWFLLSFDILFLALLFLLLGRMWGLAAAAWGLLFFASSSNVLAYATWSIFLFDWLLALTASLYCLRRRRFAAAGALWALAASLRLFPALVALFFLLVWTLGLRRRGAGPAAPLRFLGGGVAGGAAALGLATAAVAPWAGRPAAALWTDYLDYVIRYSRQANILNQVSIPRTFSLAVPGALGWMAAAALALLLARALARADLPPDKLGALSILCTPFFVTLSHYYYLMLLLVVAAREPRLRYLGWTALAVNGADLLLAAAHVDYDSRLFFLCTGYALLVAAAPVALAQKAGPSPAPPPEPPA